MYEIRQSAIHKQWRQSEKNKNKTGTKFVICKSESANFVVLITKTQDINNIAQHKVKEHQQV